jgi:hypothetical protein
MALPQGEQAGDMIDVAVGQDDARYRAVTQAVLRMERRVIVDLLPQIRRGIEDHPPPIIAGNG